MSAESSAAAAAQALLVGKAHDLLRDGDAAQKAGQVDIALEHYTRARHALARVDTAGAAGRCGAMQH